MRFEDSNKDTNDGDSVKSNPPTDTGNSVKSNPPSDTGNRVEINPPTDTGNKESNRTCSMGNKERTSSTDSVSAEASHYNTRIADAMDLHGSRLSPSTGTYVTDKYGNAKGKPFVSAYFNFFSYIIICFKKEVYNLGSVFNIYYYTLVTEY